jgi:hypothetical protein
MELTPSSFNDLAARYGMYSSWAVWDPANPADTQIIAQQLTCLKTSVVLVGLNISRPIPTHWQNFHGRDHARKLMFAYNKSPYRGAYMTDLIKGEVEANAGKLRERIRNGTVDVPKHVNTFRTEMHDVGVQEHALFILFGNDTAHFFRNHLAGVYPNHVKCPHYSRYGIGSTDAEWVDKVWTILEVEFPTKSGHGVKV